MAIIPTSYSRVVNHPGTEPGNLLERVPGRSVLLRIQVEQREHIEREPTCAHFVARKPGTIGNDDVPSGVPEHARARGPTRTTADDEGVAADHSGAPEISCGSERVHDGGADSSGTNIT